MATEAQLKANLANSHLSTGPKTPEGKAKVSHNAVKNALTGVTVLLPTDDAALYQQHVSNAFAIWAPVNHREKLLVQSIADTEWRLQRIPALESGIYALGRLQHADLFQDHDESVRPLLLETYIFQTYARDLRNLSLQDNRLRRHREKDIAELNELQTERRKIEAERTRRREAKLLDAAYTYLRYEDQEKEDTFNPAKLGFEFSIEEILQKVADCPKTVGQLERAKERERLRRERKTAQHRR